MFSQQSRCKHEHQTCCRFLDEDGDEFLTYQCDDCGLVIHRYVSDADLASWDAGDLPQGDPQMWQAAIDALCDFGSAKTLAFFAKAHRR